MDYFNELCQIEAVTNISIGVLSKSYGAIQCVIVLLIEEQISARQYRAYQNLRNILTCKNCSVLYWFNALTPLKETRAYREILAEGVAEGVIKGQAEGQAR